MKAMQQVLRPEVRNQIVGDGPTGRLVQPQISANGGRHEFRSVNCAERYETDTIRKLVS